MSDTTVQCDTVGEALSYEDQFSDCLSLRSDKGKYGIPKERRMWNVEQEWEQLNQRWGIKVDNHANSSSFNKMQELNPYAWPMRIIPRAWTLSRRGKKGPTNVIMRQKEEKCVSRKIIKVQNQQNASNKCHPMKPHDAGR